jgi:SET domain-containing protein
MIDKQQQASKKQHILSKLENTYCRIKKSGVHGVGVYAVRDIPSGIDPFGGVASKDWIEFHVDELKHLDPEVKRLVDDFFVIEKDGSVYIPEDGPNGMDVSFFVNHSKTPNLIAHEDDDGVIMFVTSKAVKKGEELTVGYETYDDKYKED